MWPPPTDRQVEVYVREHTEAELSHGICPECMSGLYPPEDDPERYASEDDNPPKPTH